MSKRKNIIGKPNKQTKGVEKMASCPTNSTLGVCDVLSEISIL